MPDGFTQSGTSYRTIQVPVRVAGPVGDEPCRANLTVCGDEDRPRHAADRVAGHDFGLEVVENVDGQEKVREESRNTNPRGEHHHSLVNACRGDRGTSRPPATIRRKRTPPTCPRCSGRWRTCCRTTRHGCWRDQPPRHCSRPIDCARRHRGSRTSQRQP